VKGPKVEPTPGAADHFAVHKHGSKQDDAEPSPRPILAAIPGVRGPRSELLRRTGLNGLDHVLAPDAIAKGNPPNSVDDDGQTNIVAARYGK
jgi:hypothetical protein